MAILVYPIENAALDGAFLFSANLDGVDYQLSFYFNSRSGFWYFDLLDVEGNHIRSGIKCVVNYPVIRLCKELTRPAGEIYLIDTKDRAGDPGLENLGVDALFVYEAVA